MTDYSFKKYHNNFKNHPDNYRNQRLNTFVI